MSHQAPKADPMAKLLFLVAAAAILVTVYVLLSSLVNTYKRNATKGEVDSTQLVALASDNLKPIGETTTSDSVAKAVPASARSGKEVFDAVCSACHTAGVAGAPKIDDKAAWEPRVKTGLDSLIGSATNGKGAMPPRGGNPAVTDEELRATIIYMTKQAGFNLGGGEAKAAAAPKAAAAAPKKEEAPVAKEEKKEEPKTEAAPKENIAAKKPEAAPEPTVPATPKQPAQPEPAPAPKAAEAPTPAAAPAAEAQTTAAPTTAAKAPAADLAAGKKVYDSACFACHATGVAGSPKFGDKAAWAPRIATGKDALYNVALHGKGAMPPKGGNMSLSDDDVKAAVDYMVSNAQ